MRDFRRLDLKGGFLGQGCFAFAGGRGRSPKAPSPASLEISKISRSVFPYEHRGKKGQLTTDSGGRRVN